LTSRRAARRTALEVLYQADVTDAVPVTVIEEWTQAQKTVPPFARELIGGVQAHSSQIDRLLDEHAEGWSVQRMTALDRSIMRIAIYELLYEPDVPASVSVSEAVEAASELSSEDARRFVNGVLGKIASEVRS
jgi:N utilization substance protein B